MNTEKYNGWTNYATWRINLEIFDGLSSDMDGEHFTGESCKEYAEGVIFSEFEGTDCLACDYAQAFLLEVNWHEIADHLNEL